MPPKPQKDVLRVAVLRNFPMKGDSAQEGLDSIFRLIINSCPSARIENFSPIDAGSFPDAANFDVIILTGGLFDLAGPEEKFDPWVRDTIDFIRETVAEHHDVKLLGLCWGHQVICHALGGKVAARQGGALVDIENIPLNAVGKRFFDTTVDSLKIYKFHKRVVRTRPENFIELAPRNEILVSKDEQILSFQGHPEMTASIVKDLVSNGDKSYLSAQDQERIGSLLEKTSGPHDGPEVWSGIMRWVATTRPETGATTYTLPVILQS